MCHAMKKGQGLFAPGPKTKTPGLQDLLTRFRPILHELV